MNDFANFLLDPNNRVFFYPLCVMIGISILEIGSSIFGSSLSGFIDNMLPEFDGDIEIEVDADVVAPGIPFYFGWLDWLNIGRVPILILMIMLLMVFVIIGYVSMYLFQKSGFQPPSVVVGVIDFVITLFLVHKLGRGFARVFPKTNTNVVNVNSLIGKIVTISPGTKATNDLPARARVKDDHGVFHNVMIYPHPPDKTFTDKDDLVIFERIGESGNKFLASLLD